MSIIEQTVCFSGHRNLYDPKETIEKQLEVAVRQCIAKGTTRFIAGGALGFDTLAAWTIIGLKNEYPQIQLFLALPCPPNEQTLKWKAEQKKEYQKIRELADDEIILATSYTAKCMLKRNEYMVDNSSKLICYLRSDHGGTKYTVEYAKKKGIDLITL